MTTDRPDGFYYFADFLNADYQAVLLKQVESLDYVHDKMRGWRLKRGYAQFGYAYITARRVVVPAPPMLPFLAAVIEKGLPKCPESCQFNQCIVTMYPKGAGIGWHPDADCFGDCIMAFSLGATAKFKFRTKETRDVCYEVNARPGSLYVMHGEARWNFEHSVDAVKGTRYSLTFRYVDKENVNQV